jgi:hypothetical protein
MNALIHSSQIVSILGLILSLGLIITTPRRLASVGFSLK